MFFSSTPAVGDHVRLTKTRTRLWGGDIKKGSLGIVRETHFGFFRSDLEIELADGTGRLRVASSDVRLTGGHGERGFELARDYHRAKLFAGLVTVVIVAIPLLRYRLSGGQWGDLVIPTVNAFIETIIGLVTGPFAIPVILFALFVYLRARARQRTR